MPLVLFSVSGAVITITTTAIRAIADGVAVGEAVEPGEQARAGGRTLRQRSSAIGPRRVRSDGCRAARHGVVAGRAERAAAQRAGAASATSRASDRGRDSASRAYVEHDGVKRHGDGRPARAAGTSRSAARRSESGDAHRARRRRRPTSSRAVDLAAQRCERVFACGRCRRRSSSHPWSSPTPGRPRATIARSRRRSRLRRVAEPTERPTAKATRNGTAAGSLRKVHHRVSVRAVRPERASVWNARRSRILQIKPTAGCGP